MTILCSIPISYTRIFQFQPLDLRTLRLPFLSFLLRPKIDTDTIDTMSLIRWRCVAFTLEHMSQVASAVCADNLRSGHAECAVRMSCHSAWHGVEKGGPSAAGFELVRRIVEGCVAGGAVVGSRRWHVFIVFAGEGSFGALLTDDFELFWIRMLAGAYRWWSMK
jgi:hypothetical protein